MRVAIGMRMRPNQKTREPNTIRSMPSITAPIRIVGYMLLSKQRFMLYEGDTKVCRRRPETVVL